MALQLRPHQEQGIADLRASLARYNSVMFRAETGYGKTVIASHIAQGCQRNDVPLWFICHRRELVEQTVSTFDQAGVGVGYIMAGKSYDPYKPVHVVSMDSLPRRWDKVRLPKYAVIDECHHSISPTWSDAISRLRAAGKVIGLTATPWRANGAGFRDHYDHMVDTVDTEWLMEHGYLSRYRVFCPSTPNMAGAHMQAGDYKATDLDLIMGKADLMGCAVANWRQQANGLRTIAFAPTVAMSQRMAQLFCDHGIPAAPLDGGTDNAARRQTIRDFADGKLHVLWNVNLFSEGFDLSAIAGRDVPIECLIQYRPTASLAMHRQQVGRVLRPKPIPAIILDHAGNTRRHGFQDDPIEWSLDGIAKKGKNDTVDTVRLCPACLESHRPRPSCPACGYVYPTPPPRQITVIEGMLAEVTRGGEVRPDKEMLVSLLDACKSYQDALLLEKNLGYKHGWAWHVSQNKPWKDRPRSKYGRIG